MIFTKNSVVQACVAEVYKAGGIMKYPCLIAKEYCTTDITLQTESEELNVYGEPEKSFKFEGKCNYQDKARTILTAEKQLIKVSGTALFRGDICPEAANIVSGKAVVNGITRNIYETRKHRNPDGTVNYTEVVLE